MKYICYLIFAVISLLKCYHQLDIYSSYNNIPVNGILPALATGKYLVPYELLFGSRHGHLSSLYPTQLLFQRWSQRPRNYEECLLQHCRPSVQSPRAYRLWLVFSKKTGKSQTQEQQISHLQG